MSWEAWGDPEDPPELPDGWLCEEEAEDLQRNVGDLAMLVAQLARALRKAAPAHDLPVRAMDYLQREGLCGSPLRETSNVEFSGVRRFLAQPPLERRVMRLEDGKMKLKNCPVCGKPVRLGAMKIRINRKSGVSHYIAHMDESPMHDKGWTCAALKPYPVREEDKPWAQLCARWNDA